VTAAATTRKALMHLDGCHFYVWVYRDYDGATVLTFAERDGDNLLLHARHEEEGDEKCDRCEALRGGVAPRYIERKIPTLPEGAQESFLTVAGLIGEIDNEVPA
jgi:hypothetical protein